MKMDSVNSRILHVFIAIGLLFVSLVASMTWFELKGKTPIMGSAYNRRLQVEEEKVLRGAIVDRSGTVLAHTEEKKGVRTRIYPYKALYTHVIGYDSPTYGKTLIEARYNESLMGRDGLGLINTVGSLVMGSQRAGHQLQLTLDHGLQKRARELMGGNRGALVAMNPKTGEILAMVSTPDFDGNAGKLETQWGALVENEHSPLLPRAMMGLYPPGSTFKIVTAAAALEKGLGGFTVEDTGSTVIDGKPITNSGSKAHGPLDMTQGMAVSSNVYFALLAEEVGPRKLLDQAARAGFGESPALEFPLKASRLGAPDMGKTELAATGIGQGKLLATPVQMAMLASGIANDGVIMAPYLIGRISDSAGTVLKSGRPRALYRFTDAETAQTLTDMMTAVVQRGTGTRAKISGTAVAGKTGTAQNEKSSQGEGFDHAWFIGFAPAEDPVIAVAVILEYQGRGGGQAAAPIAGKVMAQWLKTLEK